MQKRLTIGIAATALAATVSFVAAGPTWHKRAPAREAPPADRTSTSARTPGFSPTGEPVQRGPIYILRALDSRGVQARAVADGRLRDTVPVTRVAAPRYDFGPRIIHVPQPDERGERYDRGDRYGRDSRDDRGEAALPADVDAPPPARAPRRGYRASDVAPPPPAEQALTPIYPTPRFAAPRKN